MRRKLKIIKHRFQDFRRYVRFCLARAVVPALRLVPPRAGMALGRAAGRLGYLFSRRHYRYAFDNLRRAYPEKTPEQLRALLRETFEQTGMTAMETLRLTRPGPHPEFVISMEGEEHVRGALDKGKGVVMLTGHIGNWELLAWNLVQRGYRGAVIAKKIKSPAVDAWIVNVRRRNGVETLYREGALRQSLRFLRNGGIIGLLPDQDIRKIPGIFVDFFGLPTYTPTGPVLIAKASGAPIVPIFMLRTAPLHFRLVAFPEIDLLRHEDRDTELRLNTQRWTRIIEDCVREHPAQWAWFHRRWKTRPGDEAPGGPAVPPC